MFLAPKEEGNRENREPELFVRQGSERLKEKLLARAQRAAGGG